MKGDDVAGAFDFVSKCSGPMTHDRDGREGCAMGFKSETSKNPDGLHYKVKIVLCIRCIWSGCSDSPTPHG